MVAFFEALAPADLDRLDALYDADCRFKDPFNDVRGVPAVRRVFTHMFEALDGPRFVVREVVFEGAQCFLTWDFEFRLRRGGRLPIKVHGGSHLHFADDGRIASHVDYWDAAGELYEKLPLLGAPMRWLRRRAGG